MTRTRTFRFLILATVFSGVVLPLFADDTLVCPSNLGEQKTAVLLLDTPGRAFPTPVYSPATVRDLFFSDTQPSVNSYWKEVSYGKTWVTGDVYGPIKLPNNYSNTHSSTQTLVANVVQAADAVLDFQNYSRYVLLVPVIGSWSGEGGGGGCMFRDTPSGKRFVAVFTFLFVGTDSQPPGVLLNLAAHEMTHQLGVHHANTLDFGSQPLGPPGADAVWSDYGDWISIMGGSVFYSSNGQTLHGHVNARHKAMIGWFQSGTDFQDVETDGKFKLQPLETATTGLKAIRIRRAADSDKWLWVEYRQPIGFDATLSVYSTQLFSGALIYYEDPTEPNTTVVAYRAIQSLLLDFTAGTTPHNFKDPALAAGKSWTDPFGPVTIAIGAAGPDGLDVTVTYDTPCATFSPTGRAHGPGIETGTIAVSAPVDCKWTATAYGDWISMTGGQSGTGPGTVAYSLPANTGPKARKGFVTVARQNFVIDQAAVNVPPVVKSISPNSGGAALNSDVWRNFEFIYSDKNTWSDLRLLYVLFSTTQDTAAACYIEYDVLKQTFRLADDTGANWSPPSSRLSGPTLSNSQCRLNGTGEGDKNDFYLDIGLIFNDTFTGAKNIYTLAVDAAGATSTWQASGTWKIFVNQAPDILSVTPGSGSGSGQVFTYTATDPNGFDDLDYIAAKIGAKSTSAFCWFDVSLSQRKVMLLSEDGRTWLGTVNIGAAAALQHSMCGIDASGVTITGSGTDATVSVPVLFTSRSAGSWSHFADTADMASSHSYTRKLGTWTVPATSCVYAIDPTSVTTGPNETRGTITVNTAAGCAWLASTTTPWIRITSSPSGSGAATVSYTVFTTIDTQQRSGSITITGQSVTFTQAGRNSPLGPPAVDITKNPMVNGASFEPGIASSTWISIRGTNLAPTTRPWTTEDFEGNKLPTRLDGVSVTLNGKNCLISYISPTQLNVLTPDEDGLDTAAFGISTPAGGFAVNYASGSKRLVAPAFFMFDAESRKYIAGVHADGAFLGKAGLYPGLNVSPAKPGEIVSLFGTGFGQTDPPQAAGELVDRPSGLAAPVVLHIGGVVAEVKWAGLTASGLYQFNVVVPDLPNGDQAVWAQVSQVPTQANAFITVQR